jgi:hypothetical protein
MPVVVATLVVVTPLFDDEIVTELYPELELDASGASGGAIYSVDTSSIASPPAPLASSSSSG